jgi:hypothetical protein
MRSMDRFAPISPSKGILMMSSDRLSQTRRRRPNVTRFVVRVTGDRPWRWEVSYEAILLIERTLKKLLEERRLELDLSHLRTPQQSIKAIDLFQAELRVPMDGAQAYREGFLRHENPHRWGTGDYRLWRKDYDGAKMWSVRE